MDNKKFEQLIDLIINENEEQAKALFHDIVVEKSREIYESMMDDMDEGQGIGGQVGDILDEINAEEEGMTEEEEDLEFGDDDGDEVVDLEMGDEEGDGEEDLEDRVVDLEDKLDQLMAEFEEIMGGEGAGDEEGGEEDFGGEEGGEEDFGDEEGAGEEDMMESSDDEEEDEEDDLEESVMEAIALKNVPGLYGSKIGGDNGAQTKSPSLVNSGQAGMEGKPVKASTAQEAGRTAPKAGELIGKVQNSVGGDKKLSPAAKPTLSQASGVNTKTPFPKN